MPELSLIVCTHRRFGLLQLAVESLCNQTADRDAFEVVVVDNDRQANAEVKQLVEQAKEKIRISYLFEPVLGLSQARNSGGKTATASYIGYLDDDAKAPSSYVENALAILRSKAPDYFGGPYEPWYQDGKPAWFKDEYEAGKSANETRYLKAGEFLNGTNMIYKRSLLDELGWFDTSFGMTGKKTAYGEETALQMKAWEQGRTPAVFYDRELVVQHLAMPVKLKLSDRFRRKYSMGRSQAYLWISEAQKQSVRKKAPVVLLKTTLSFFFKGLPGLLMRNKKKYPAWQNYAYEVLANYAASLGQELRYLSGR